MPPSQLKRLKASLKEHGITGPEKSKKEKKTAAKADSRIQRNAALSGIRESFRPFEVNTASRPTKMAVTTAKNMKSGQKTAKQILGRPGVTKSHGEQNRRNTLLSELQKRNKVGGILDRRFGENDPSLAPEDRALLRFTREQETKGRNGASMFDLELEDSDEEGKLTHMGLRLALDKDDFAETNLGSADSSDSDSDTKAGTPGKRKRDHSEVDEQPLEDESQRKKSKAEVMKEVIAKSKLYKYERQQAKENDDAVREQLDKGVGDLRAALFSFQNLLSNTPREPTAQREESMPNKPFINPDRAALIQNTLDPDQDYDRQIRRMALDKRSKPTGRTKTSQEIADEDAEHSKNLEQDRLRRMKGEDQDDDPESMILRREDGDIDVGKDDVDDDDAAMFGLTSGRLLTRPAGCDDEDEFMIDDLVAVGSDASEDSLYDESLDSSSVDEMLAEDHEVPEYFNELNERANGTVRSGTELSVCPSTYDELEGLLKGVQPEHTQLAIRQVRQRFDTALNLANKEKLVSFARILVEYLGLRPNLPDPPSLKVFEAIIRHLHSLSRTYANPIAQEIRSHLERMRREQTMNAGDLMILTAVGVIYPTSDHFHQVVTPAMTLMARWLGLNTPKAPADLVTGSYVVALCIKYQLLSRRYIPELMKFTISALSSAQSMVVLEPHIINLADMADLWSTTSAFTEMISPSALNALRSLKRIKSLHHIQILLDQAQLSRRPLQLHHHRPVAIKTAIPKFEEDFNPTKHYDPDRERAESAKLQKEYKREKKGALRELRKDANFLAREKLTEKRERDRAYEEKYRRLVAEIQGEEGKEKNAYEREKRMRKGQR